MKNNTKITQQMHDYRKISTTRTLLTLLTGSLAILFLLVFYMWLPNCFTFLIAFPLVGTIQYRLLALLHDAQHSLLSNNRIANDQIAVWLLAAPSGVIFSKSRYTHIEHHKNLENYVADPDYSLYCTHNPTRKNPIKKTIEHFFHIHFWDRLLRTVNTITKSANGSTIPRIKKNEIFAVYLTQFFVLAFFTLAGFWQAYFYMWLLPLITTAPLLNYARIFCEHSNTHCFNSNSQGLLISYISTPIERFFFDPHHMNYHAEHHFFSFVPHYCLPQVRKILQTSPKYQNQIQWRRGYLSRIKAYLDSINRNNTAIKLASETKSLKIYLN